MRSMVSNAVGGVVCATCLLMGFPLAAENPPKDAALTDPYCTRPGSVIWKRQIGTPETDGVHSVATDAANNVVIAGKTCGSLYEGCNPFDAKYDADGNRLWTHEFGTRADLARGVATDAVGNIVIAGWTYHSPPNPHLPDIYDAFVTKYDASGKRLWGRQLLGTDPWGQCCDYGANGVATDTTGGVVIAGEIRTMRNPGYKNAFVAKYAANGNHLWTREIGSDFVYATSVTADSTSVIIAGYTFGSSFVVKYDADGNHLWTREIGTGASDLGAAGVAADAAGNVVMAGTTEGSLAGPNKGGFDAFVVKYDADGNHLWTRQLGTGTSDVAAGVAIDSAGNIVIAGNTGGSLGGPNKGSTDAFVVKYDADGKRLWQCQFGTGSDDYVSGVAMDAANNVVIAGRSSGSLGGSNKGGEDAFIIKLRP